MTLLGLVKELALEAGRGAVLKLAELIAGKPREEEKARGLSHKDVEHQQAQIRAATAHKVPKR
jgi:hypothetical protein